MLNNNLVSQEFCPRHLYALPLQEAPAPRHAPPASKKLWLTLLLALMLHIGLLLWWPPRPLPTITPVQTLSLTLKQPQQQALPETVETAPEPISDPMPEPMPELTPEPIPEAAPENFPDNNLPATSPAQAREPEVTQPLDLRWSISPPPAATTAPGSTNVFHPGLQEKLHNARHLRQRLQDTEKTQLSTFRDSAGNTWADLGNGKCMRSTDREGGGQNWELPRPCAGWMEEGESMLRNVQKRIDNRTSESTGHRFDTR